MATEGHPCYSRLPHTSAETRQCMSSLRRNPCWRLVDRVRLEYYRYEVTFGLYVMTPREKFVVNSVVSVCIALLLWALLQYFPSLLHRKVVSALLIVEG
ncbi:hypothetical protein N7457_005225 [Penicillium paradoxum]|uniref:uncharacterized protein n=1 Tax=Penicillium paradoxum TaxID=176176 RepID=UPI00254981DF|nr:uncharacterized protein N7457_005225 [Penicillium paradoxum]KAJ5780065.1 hypothetical protein N7457_005225 [Penicillium paradoxum]